jgi:hypothetical protein
VRKATSLFAILLAVSAVLAQAQVVVTVGSQPLGVVSIGETAWVPCANNGQGEYISLFGPEALRWTYVTYSDGSIKGHVYADINFKGVGLTTNQPYHSKVTIMGTFTNPPGSFTQSNALSQSGVLVENLPVTGDGISFHYHESVTYYYTFDSNGQLVSAQFYHGNIFLACH